MKAKHLCWFLAALPLFAQSWPRYTNPMKLDLRVPGGRPYIALTPSLIEHARARAAAAPWAKQQVDRILSQANELAAKGWGQLPPKAAEEHRAISGRLFTAALAYTFSGDKRYAEWTRDGLLAYAAIYPGLTPTRGRSKLFTQSSLFEATWVVPVAQAYDLIADSGVFSAEQARSVENDLLRPAAACFKIDDFTNDQRIKDLHFRCYNFQAWHISAVGLVGLAVKDPDLVDWAVNSPYGLRHLIAHDINDDGFFWERSESYHDFVVRALLPFTEALLHCGVDVYNMTVPADRAKDEDSHYMTDSSDAPKSLRLLFEPLFYVAFPDGSFPALGDSHHGPLRASAATVAAWNRYRDPKLAWLVERSRPEKQPALPAAGERRSGPEWQWLIYDSPADAPASLPVRDGKFANTGQYRNGCSLFPSTGLAVLRQAAGDFTSAPDSTAVTLSYGPHGGGHGHSDKLNIVVYSQGRQWIPDFGSMTYETRWKADWTAQSVSHNTITVDGISQKPTGRRATQWPSDTASDRVIGALERFDPASKSASAYCDKAYEGIRLRRAVRLSDGALVDAFTAADSGGAAHQYDYVLHIDGQLENSSVPLEPASGKLGESAGYQLIEQKRRGVTGGAFTLTFSGGGKQLRIWAPAGDATEIILGEGLTNSPEKKMPLLILRRKSARTQFLTVFEPMTAGEGIRAVRFEKGALAIQSARGTRRVPVQ